MAANQNVLSALVGLISSLVTCVQLNVAMSTVHLNYVKQRFDILRILSVSDGRIPRHKHLKRAGRQPRPLKFYTLYTLLIGVRPRYRSKAVRLTLVVFLCVLPLLWHIASNKAKYLHSKKTKNLTFARSISRYASIDTNTNLPPKTR